MSRKILVVEDDQVIRESIVIALESQGYKVDQAADGCEAVRYLKELGEDPCLVLTDLFMPNDGNELIKMMRQTDEFMTIPVVVISAAQLRCPPSGVLFIKKPFGITELIENVNKFCGDSKEEDKK